MLNIVVPMAGRGARFEEAGYTTPKPFIPVHGIPMIEVVINNLRPSRPHRFTFICQRQHQQQFQVAAALQRIEPTCGVILLDGVTAGAACTVLQARHAIDNQQPLMIANCDQWINASIDDYLAAFDASRCDGFIMTMQSNHSKWSYVHRGADGAVNAVVEKQVVSAEATVGIYNFARGADFVRASDRMIAANARVNGEFYVAPSYTWLIQGGGRIETHSIGTDRDGMYGLGVPADLEHFLTCGFESRLRQERRALERAAA